jgi:AF1548-like, C-terminal/Restriction endonuclease
MGRRKKIAVTKCQGHDQPFDEPKLRASLLRAGADDDLIKIVLGDVRSQLVHGDSTDAIRRVAMRALRREARHVAGRYNLKRAVMKLGPGGYAFERYWGGLLEELGYSTTYDETIRGRCVDHEVDVVATKNKQRRLAECKFHNAPGARTDIQVALYVYARSLDLRKRKPRPPGSERFELVTNTRFSTEAMRYAQCVHLNLVGWDYPVGGSLRDLADQYALYPITCLSKLKVAHQKTLLSRRVATCRELVEHPELLENLGLSARQVAGVLQEATALQSTADVARRARAQLL